RDLSFTAVLPVLLLVVSGFGLGWCPAGAGVVAGRAVPALAELAQLLLAGEDDPVPAAGSAAGGDPAAVDPVVDAGGGHAELGGQSREGTAEDVVQDAFLGLYRRWPGLSDTGNAL